MEVSKILKGNIDDSKTLIDKTWSSNKINAEFNKKLNKEEPINITMEASKWSLGEYSFESKYPAAKYNMLLKISSKASDPEKEAWNNAKLIEDDDLNKLKADGEVPKINIPIILMLFKK